MAASKKVIFELFWGTIPVHVPGHTAVIQSQEAIHIRVKRSSDITFHNQQGYRDKADALRTIRGHVEQIGGVDMEELLARGRIKITGPGKKPS